MRRQNLGFPLANGSALPAIDWTTQTIANGGGAGTDTFAEQNFRGRIGCVAASANSKQHLKYTNAQGNHKGRLEYRGLITWSAAAGDVTNFIVRSDQVVVADSNFHANCYIFEFDLQANTVVAYVVAASVPVGITGAPAAASFTVVAATLYNVYFLLDEYTLSVKIWAVGTSEPGAWTYTVTDPSQTISALTTGGWTWANQHVPTTVTNIEIGNAWFQSDLAQPPQNILTPLAFGDAASPRVNTSRRRTITPIPRRRNSIVYPAAATPAPPAYVTWLQRDLARQRATPRRRPPTFVPSADGPMSWLARDLRPQRPTPRRRPPTFIPAQQNPTYAISRLVRNLSRQRPTPRRQPPTFIAAQLNPTYAISRVARALRAQRPVPRRSSSSPPASTVVVTTPSYISRLVRNFRAQRPTPRRTTSTPVGAQQNPTFVAASVTAWRRTRIAGPRGRRTTITPSADGPTRGTARALRAQRTVPRRQTPTFLPAQQNPSYAIQRLVRTLRAQRPTPRRSTTLPLAGAAAPTAPTFVTWTARALRSARPIARRSSSLPTPAQQNPTYAISRVARALRAQRPIPRRSTTTPIAAQAVTAPGFVPKASRAARSAIAALRRRSTSAAPLEQAATPRTRLAPLRPLRAPLRRSAQRLVQAARQDLVGPTRGARRALRTMWAPRRARRSEPPWPQRPITIGTVQFGNGQLQLRYGLGDLAAGHYATGELEATVGLGDLAAHTTTGQLEARYGLGELKGQP